MARLIARSEGAAAFAGKEKPLSDNRENLLWSEMSPTERALEKSDFIQSFMYETGCDEPTAKLHWEQYLNQEGYTGRDERVMMRRERNLSSGF